MSTKQDIIRTLQTIQAEGVIAKRFFQVTAPQHADSILEKMNVGETFLGFILLPNSKKQPTEALICTNQRILVWNNEFAEDEEFQIKEIKSFDTQIGWFSTQLHLHVLKNDSIAIRTFKCEKRIMKAFETCLLKAMPTLADEHGQTQR